MSYHLVGALCFAEGCSRGQWRDGLCSMHWRQAGVAGRAQAVELCRDVAAMQRTLQEIRELDEAA